MANKHSFADISKIKTEYQLKLNVDKMKHLSLNQIFDEIQSLFDSTSVIKSLKIDHSQAKTKLLTKISYQTDQAAIDRRISIRARNQGNQKNRVIIKYNSPSLAEILYLNTEAEQNKKNESKIKLEQDIYNKYCKFSISFTQKYRSEKHFESVADLKEIFPDNVILKDLPESTPLKYKTEYMKRYKSLVITDGHSWVNITLDLIFKDKKSAIKEDLSQLNSSEVSFRIKGIERKKIELASLAFKAMNKLKWVQTDFIYKAPDFYFN